jgi:hypothetical protein
MQQYHEEALEKELRYKADIKLVDLKIKNCYELIVSNVRRGRELRSIIKRYEERLAELRTEEIGFREIIEVVQQKIKEEDNSRHQLALKTCTEKLKENSHVQEELNNGLAQAKELLMSSEKKIDSEVEKLEAAEKLKKEASETKTFSPPSDSQSLSFFKSP